MRSKIVASVLALVLLLSVSQYTPGSMASPASQASSRTFPETGHTVRGTFLKYWDEHGGLAQQGYPISEEMQEQSEVDGKTYTVQYFERAVFELHPENQPPNDVLLSLLGVFLYKQKYEGSTGAPSQTPNSAPDAVKFPETGKSVGGKFLAYWKGHGGLAQQGLPISDEFQERSDLDGKPYTVQYFERAVFELHPENAGTPYEVLLSQLGTFRYKARVEAPRVTATPSATPGDAPTPTKPSERFNGQVYENPIPELSWFRGFEWGVKDGNGQLIPIKDPKKFAWLFLKGSGHQQGKDENSILPQIHDGVLENFQDYRSVGSYRDSQGGDFSYISPTKKTIDFKKPIRIITFDEEVPGGNTSLYDGKRYSIGVVDGQLRIHLSSDYRINPIRAGNTMRYHLEVLADLGEYQFPDRPEDPYGNSIEKKYIDGTTTFSAADFNGVVGP